MIFKYYHLAWGCALAAGFLTSKHLFRFIEKKPPDLLLAVLLSVIFFVIVTAITIKKVFKPAISCLKIILVVSVFIFYVAGIFSFAGFIVDVNNRILKHIYDFSRAANTEITIEGRVTDHPRFYKGNLFFDIETYNVKIRDIDLNTEKVVSNAGLFPVSLVTDCKDILIRDDFVQFTCQVQKNKNLYFFYGYDTGIKRISPGSVKQYFFYLRSKIYNCVKCLFYNNLKFNSACLCEGIILGNTGNIPEIISLNFRKSGIYHLLAISGLHISFFVLIVTGLLRNIGPEKIEGKKIGKLKAFIKITAIIVILFLYNLIIGSRASTIRATMMSIYLLIALYSGREIMGKTVLSYTFILLLVVNPGFFIDAGFWLTFTAVFAIVYLNKPLMELMSIIEFKIFKRIQSKKISHDKACSYGVKNYFISIFSTAFSVNIFLFPILLFLFKEASILSIFMNPLAISIFYILLFILIVSSLFSLFLPPAGGVIVKTGEIFIDLLIKLAKTWKFFGFSIIKIKDFKVMHLIIYYVILISILLIISIRINIHKGRKIKRNSCGK